MQKKPGKTIWNSNRRAIEIQTRIASRFRKAAMDSTPVILAHQNVQKSDKLRERPEGNLPTEKVEKIQKSWRPGQKLLAAKNFLSLRPIQPTKFFRMPNFADQESGPVTAAHVKFWEDTEFFYVNNKNL